MTGRRREDRGSGSVLTVVTVALVLAGFVVVIVIGSYLVADHRAMAAADQAALSAARVYAATGERSTACNAASRAAVLNDARVLECRLVGDLVDHVTTVEVAVDVGVLWPGLPGQVRARASAGRLTG